MNDFETVRRHIIPKSGMTGGSEVPNALAALDRIEAEVERLREQSKADRDNLTACRKRAAEQGNEVERLRAEAVREHAIAERMTEEFREVSNEVERLRTENAKLAQGILPAGARVTFEEVTPIHTDP